MKNITGAIRTIKENNILGGTCGELCPTERLCEKECAARLNSNDVPEGCDTPIQIGKIQRALIQHGRERKFRVFEPPTATKEKVAIIGSGPAGLSCAAELAKIGYKPTIFEARPEPGGVLRYGVTSFRFNTRFLQEELEDIENLGVEFKCNTRIEGQKAAQKLLDQGFSAVFLAPGLWAAAALEKEPPDISGLYSSVNYLAALRDGRLEEMYKEIKGKRIAVIGGGSVAMDCAESAAKLEAQDVFLVYRRSFNQMPAEKDEQITCLEAGVHYFILNQPLHYVSDGQDTLTGIKLIRTRLGETDASGRRRPEAIEGSQWILDADIVIEAIGNEPEADSPQWYPDVQLNDKKLVTADPETCETSVKGIFAGGDIVRGPSLVVNAVKDGKTAAKAIGQYLSN
ncbi:MAG: FAD-dependent oxidoreductase [bacterium]|nr:FAD-dependent oxidoreductase [bacterium]